MINFPIFVDGLSMSLEGLVVFVVSRDQKERNKVFQN